MVDVQMRPQGPWVKKLIVRLMSKQAIPDNGTIFDGLKFLSDAKAIGSAARSATVEAFKAIDLVRSAHDCRWETDEEIARAIVTTIDATGE